MLIHPDQTSSRPLSDRLRAAGSVAWSLVGIALLVTAAVLLLVFLRPIVLSLLVALFLAIAFLPVVDALERRHVPRGIGAAAALLIVIVVGVGSAVLVAWGVVSHQEEIARNLNAAIGRLHSTLSSAGVGRAVEAGEKSARQSTGTLLAGLLPALGNLLGTGINVLLGLFVALFICFFLLKDGHAMAARAAGWLPLPEPRGQRLLGQAAAAIRRYYVGLTLLGVFNAVMVTIGALILHVPLVGPIAVITLLGTYVPYLGAAVSSAFAVLIALGAVGQSAAMWMILIVVLANGLLQNLVSPFAYGAALRISPPVVLLATMLGGALAGVVGLALATPVTAVVTRIAKVLKEPHQGAEVGDRLPPDGHPAAPAPEQ